MTPITDSTALAALCDRLAKADFVTVDTEFVRDTTYWPKLCLVQLAGPEDAAIVDPLAEGLDLAPLVRLLNEEPVIKVFHAARQDLEIFFHMTGQVPAPVFDTQVAAMVCGFGDQVSYEKLAGALAGARIDKGARYADWVRRPLTERQLDYALSDVTYLRKAYEKLVRKLEKNRRADWLNEEMAVLTDPQTYDLHPERAWLRLKTRSRDRRYLVVLKALATWREEEAQRRDLPRNRVLRDEQLYDIAQRAPKGTNELAHTRGLNEDFARGRLGKGILAAIEAALAQPQDLWPSLPKEEALPDAPGPIADLLKMLLKVKCDSEGVAPKLVANSLDIERLASGEDNGSPLLHGWRYEVFGRDAEALMAGRLAIAARDGKAVALPLDGAD
ncbi:ribonuclease D [Tistlia consotensis]|uniref:Ribonuclease D n=1 Tax=Tistlia consotensis USBA 355 TaxID=560819 RepID=A0A1Y6BRR9_9PROT|nr:ribonuclease D [Tistlia consotensis]SMF22115.1 ribonuclease D [Tistlia consotensis USBA 355]SNR46282.1 ribonuclease D [Tistlia consotensis]